MVAYLKQTVARGTEVSQITSASPAKAMGAKERCDLATRVLAGNESVSQAAREHQVSRKFVAKQKAKAQDALDEAFAPSATDSEVLFHLPVTKAWIKQAALGLALTCHSSQRGIVGFFADHFDYRLSLGSVHNTLVSAAAKAREHNAAVELSRVDVAVLDEIFQARWPILVGADAASTYCFLLSREEHRDADTWGIRLLEQADRGLAPEAASADFGTGLRAGLAQAMPGVPCGGDVFHALMDLQDGVRTLVNRAYRAIEQRGSAEHKRHKPTRKKRSPGENSSLARHLYVAQQAERQAIDLASDVRTLVEWLRCDILAIAGPHVEDRRALYDFVRAELRPRLERAATTLKPILTLLGKHRDDLLAFAEHLDKQLDELAHRLEVAPDLLRDLLAQRAGNPNHPDYWQREAQLHHRAGGRWHQLRQAVERLRRRTVRASSVVENLNRRLRSYFFLRRHLGPDYLELLQFYLNHRRFPRSERPERTGKSPRQLLTGQEHPHWLEMLGYQRFERN